MGATIFLDIFMLFYRMLPFDFYFNYIIYIVFILNFIIKKKTVKLLPKWFMKTWLFMIIISYITGALYGTGGFTMHKQVIGVTFSSVAFYAYFAYNNFNVKLIFSHYLNLSYIVAIMGLFDEMFHLVGIHLTLVKGTSIGLYRVYSIMAEPYYLAVILTPALFYYINLFIGDKIIRNRAIFRRLVVITICYVLTFSTIGFMAIAIICVFILYNKGFFSLKKGKVVFLPIIVFVLAIGFLAAKDSVNVFKEKIEDTYIAFTERNFDYEFVSNLNSSTFALYTNYAIAEYSFIRNPISGSGLGSHQINYDLMFSQYFDEIFLETFGSLNRTDANSLFLRLMSEMGIVGLLLLFVFLFKFLLKRRWLANPGLAHIVLINQGVFIMIVLRVIRTGNYIGNGFFFFFFLYWASWKICKNYEKYGKILCLNGKPLDD